jgi:hypothetical protein
MADAQQEQFQRYMQASPQEAQGVLLWHIVKQTEHMEAMRSHLRSVVAFIVALIGLFLLGVFLMFAAMT